MSITGEYGFLFSVWPCNSGTNREEEPVLPFIGLSCSGGPRVLTLGPSSVVFFEYLEQGTSGACWAFDPKG